MDEAHFFSNLTVHAIRLRTGPGIARGSILVFPRQQHFLPRLSQQEIRVPCSDSSADSGRLAAVPTGFRPPRSNLVQLRAVSVRVDVIADLFIDIRLELKG